MPSFRLLLLAILLPGALAAQQPMLSLDFETGSLSEASTTGEAETSAWTISNWPLLAVAAMATPVVQEAESGRILISYESGGSTTDLFVQPGEFLVFEQGAAQDDIKEDVLAELENGDVRQELPFPQWVHFSYRSASEPPPLKSAKEPSLEAVPEVLRDLENKLPGLFLSPVLRTATGATLVVPDAFLVRLRPESVQDAESVFKEEGLEILVENLAGMKGVYQVRPFHKRNGYDLLLYVNGDLRRRKEVLWTDADFVRTGAVPAAPCVSTNATIPAVNSDWLKAVDTSDPNPANHTYGIDIQPAWDNCGGADSAGNSLATIGILDEGVDYLHQDLAANMVSAGGNFTHGDNSCCLPTSSPPGCLDGMNMNGQCVTGVHTTGEHFTGYPGAPGTPYNCEMHGTWVAGPIAALSNSAGGTGAGPHLSLLSARAHYRFPAFNCTSGTEYNNVSRSSEIANAIHWLVDQGARVLNHSWTIEDPDSDCMRDKYLEVRNDDDVIAFAAVGNDNDPATIPALYPAGYKWVNGIGAIKYDGNRWELGAQGSNRGRHVHLVAPGDSLIQPDPTGSAGQPGNYLIYDGATSLATAMASGVAGLMIAEDPELTPHIIEVLLRRTAENDLPGSSSTPNTDTGFGLIDAGAAVTLVTKGVMWADDFEWGDFTPWSVTQP